MRKARQWSKGQEDKGCELFPKCVECPLEKGGIEEYPRVEREKIMAEYKNHLTNQSKCATIIYEEVTWDNTKAH